MLFHPRVIRRALDGEIECYFEAELFGLLHEPVEVVDRAEIRVNRIVPTFFRPDRPRRADVFRLPFERVVLALPVGMPDRVDRRQVHDIEAHAGESCELRDRRIEGSMLGHRAGRAREELVPGAETRPLAIHLQLQRVVHGGAVSRLKANTKLVHPRIEGRPDARILPRFAAGRDRRRSDRFYRRRDPLARAGRGGDETLVQ
jgi:hypothetical protein